MVKMIAKYDVAISFSGDDREVAESLASSLDEAGLQVFYDRYEEANLWGKSLYDHLTLVYRDLSKFCMMLLSESYGKKMWPTHERRAAQSRAIAENHEYILPIRLDEAEIPSVLDTVAYIDYRETSISQIVALVEEKIREHHETSGIRARLTTFLIKSCPDGLAARRHILHELRAAVPEGTDSEFSNAVGELKDDGLALLETMDGHWWIRPHPRSYEIYDRQLMGWDTDQDARVLASLMLNRKTGRARVLLEVLGWEKRRFNPAQRVVAQVLPSVLASDSPEGEYIANELPVTPEAQRRLKAWLSGGSREKVQEQG